MSFQAGEKIEQKYRVERLLGQGAFGEVYLVTHLALGVPRAIKVLRRDAPGLGSSDYQDMETRFRLEAQLGAQLNSPGPHPYLLQVYDLRLADDQLLLEMEYAPGGDLFGRMQQVANIGRAYPLEQALRVGREIAGGLAALHAIDIIHRDLKPANILFDEKGRARLADLGLAQVPHGPSMRSQLSNAMRHPGTPGYMSPEQQNSSDFLAPSSDIYALGLVLFETLTGRVYRTQRPGTTVRKLRPELPVEVDELLVRMLAKNPEERPWDGAEVAELLAAFLGEHPQTVHDEPGTVNPPVPMSLPAAVSLPEPVATAGLKISAQLTVRKPEDLPEAARRDWNGVLAALKEPAGSGGLLDWLEQDILAGAIRARDLPRREEINKILDPARQYQQLISVEKDDQLRQELFTDFLVKIEGYQTPSIVLDPSAELDFGHLDEKTGKVQRVLRVSNLAGDLLVFRLESANPALRVTGAGAGQLRAGESAELQVELDAAFAPPGNRELQLILRTNQGPRQLAVRYSLEKAALQVEPKELLFDPGQPVDNTLVEISNPGTAELLVELRSELGWLNLGTDRKFSVAPGGSRRVQLNIQTKAMPWGGVDAPTGLRVHSNVGDLNICVKCRQCEAVIKQLAPGVSMEFVMVPAGEFTMGSTKNMDEKPIHKVQLPLYHIGKYPVTNRQYEVFVKAGGKMPQHWTLGKIPAGKEDHPVVYVSWENASAFCDWLSKMSGLSVRLPSEAEWEKAARGTDGREYPWGNDAPDWKNCNSNRNEKDTTPVGKYSPQGDSPYGCADLAGNVWEWTADWYQAYPGNTVNDSSYGKNYRVLRGGSWSATTITYLRTSNRLRDEPTYMSFNIGFRCACLPYL